MKEGGPPAQEAKESYKGPDAGRSIGKPEFLGRAKFLFLENAVEVGHVVEAAAVGNLADALSGINQHTGGMAKPDLV